MNKCLVIIKPDAVKNGYTGSIINELERYYSFKIVHIKMMNITKGLAKELYREHKKREGFGRLLDFMANGDCVVLAIEDENYPFSSNELLEIKCELRQKYATNESIYHNAIHISDTEENAEREIALFFGL